MIRPYLVNFSAIISDEYLSIRASVTDSETIINRPEESKINSPIQSVGLFSKENFRIKIIGLTAQNKTLFKREYDSDNYGRFEIKFSSQFSGESLEKLIVYETSKLEGMDIYLGSFLPLIINNPKKIIISDFDKTLVDTKYSTPTELYYSLNKPLNYFPSVLSSIEMLNEHIEQGFQPFILSASPHFYENSIRDWFYQNNIFISDIFLKDYRDFISIFDGKLTTKDLKKQGFYKLNQLIDILLMTRIPEELVLMGDGFESDPFIYLTLKKLLTPHNDPWKIWNTIKNHRIFNLTGRQDSQFITKFYLLNNLAKTSDLCKVSIHIRATESNVEKLKNFEFEYQDLTELNKSVHYYVSNQELRSE